MKLCSFFAIMDEEKISLMFIVNGLGCKFCNIKIKSDVIDERWMIGKVFNRWEILQRFYITTMWIFIEKFNEVAVDKHVHYWLWWLREMQI